MKKRKVQGKTAMDIKITLLTLTPLQKQAMDKLVISKCVNVNNVAGNELRAFNALCKKGVAQLDFFANRILHGLPPHTSGM